LDLGGGIDPSKKNISLNFENFGNLSGDFVPLIKMSILARGIRSLVFFQGGILFVQK
jgi:hypothetical protein